MLLSSLRCTALRISCPASRRLGIDGGRCLRSLSTHLLKDDADGPRSLFSSKASKSTNDDIDLSAGIVSHRDQNELSRSRAIEVEVEEEPNLTSLLMELPDRVGVLHDVLRFFWKHDVNLRRIESRPSQLGIFDFFVDLEGSDQRVEKLLASLEEYGVQKLLILDEKEVTWFPRHISELDLVANRVLDAGTDLEADHPGFHDQVYRKRREELAEFAMKHRWNKPIATIDYTDKEIHCWTAVWDRMETLWDKYACKEYLHSLDLMKNHCNYNRNAIPQQQDITKFLESRTKFKMRPVAGLLSSRDFLNGLAHRTFFCTQYIRHHSKPLYTPEPDICHELLGHAPMFANSDFCDFSQEIGLASLGATDEDIEKLARCYWFSVEFGLCKEYDPVEGRNRMKAYGAGLLSSFGELEYACGENGDEGPQIEPWDPMRAAMQEFPITTYQPLYFLSDSLADAKCKMRKHCEGLPRPFFAQYNCQTQTVFIDRQIKRMDIDS